ncbi:ABC transporter substrate-binding protein [Hyunsoonleella pacifica]|uniref:ABC transporter substrate-binding protein n=1 Tax=Hyunsoonleella pacifica TaxID=1080224 RepID=A0A4Q9FMF2_9FLAO|nr:ABC transporter substrate-binding protein [Hyunsoonleella pacifica]TBN15397.1 ABC transporter substrate-binding protein [Hyunsoonleella pacifica]GGD23722.1 ABC transporter substrate-binding protein [Hyunsoonleella pacifica]
MKKLIFILSVLLFASCKNEHVKKTENVNGIPVELKYAEGFSIIKHANFKEIEVYKPWPGASKTYKYVLISKDEATKTAIDKNAYNSIITKPINKIAVTSTTHLPALELLHVEKTLVGFPGTDYVSSKKIRTQIDNGNVKELGKNEGLNTEVLLELHPDLLVAFGIDGGNRSLETIQKSGIPVIFNGDWVESSPLAKAEWIKFFGALYDKEKEADSIFNTIENNYLDAKKLAQNVTSKPKILSGAMHSDIWYLPNGTSTEAQFLKDANVNYIWNDTEGSGSLKLNFESVFVKAKNADIWLSPSNYSSYENLKNGNENHALFTAFKNKNIYTFTNTTGATGGVTYYELGMTRPDLILKDIIKICHPELLQEYSPYFFKPLK